jgi:signal transduction histidine kinase
VLDLSDADLDQQTRISLNGEWIFHWEELLTPDNYELRNSPGTSCTVPSYWSSYQIDGKALPGMGYGTYSLKIILPRDYQSSICFDIPVFDVAYHFYLNQRLMSSNGKVGTSKEEEQPWYDPSSFCYIPDGDTLQLLIQVSNFHHRRGGFWQPLYMGGAEEVLDRKERNRMYSYSTAGVLFFFMIFFLIFWSFTRTKIMLLFAITTLGILIRTVNTGLFMSNNFVEASWSWQIRMEYLGTYLAFFLGMVFLHNLFPRRHMYWVIRSLAALITLAMVSLFVLPVEHFSYEMMIVQPLMLIGLVHYLVISFLGTLKRKTLDAVFFVSLALFILTMVNDILLANSGSAVSSTYLSQLSFQLFILAMAVLVVLQWVRNNKERERLEASLVFKNRVLSVIAHDLKAPVASVAQFSDLLATKPQLSSKPHVISSLQQSSQAAVSLLDNLLYWGRSQADALQTSPIQIEFESLLKEVGALFQHMAVQKDLEFTINSEPGLRVFADQATLNIVIRNLVSNALKFTPQKGKVEIRAWKEADKIKCSVKDTGIGIKPEFLELFEKEGQLTSTTGTDQEIGTGLGLQLVRELVKKNHGTLDIESKMEVGSTFTISLPADN